MLRVNPHFIFADSNYRGYGVAEFTPAGMTTTLRAVEDATNPQSGIRTLAKFAVESGRPKIQRVI
jgi:alkaline phosphatase D